MTLSTSLAANPVMGFERLENHATPSEHLHEKPPAGNTISPLLAATV
jgi:hypothetical protein